MSEPHDEHLRESWFAKPAPYSIPPPISSLPPPPPERALSATFFFGAFTGALGGAAALVVAEWVATRQGLLRADLARFAIGAAIGAAVGGMMALVIRHSRRFIARAIFAAVSSTTLWFCLHVALVSRHKPTLPLVPMLLGSCVYGVFVALVPPSRR